MYLVTRQISASARLLQILPDISIQFAKKCALDLFLYKTFLASLDFSLNEVPAKVPV